MRYTYTKELEESIFGRQPGEFYFFIFLNWLFHILAIGWAAGCSVFWSSFSLSLTTLWSCYNPSQPVTVFYVIQLPARYLPLVQLLVEFATGGDLAACLLGAGAGAFWFFNQQVYPKHFSALRQPLLKVPRFFILAPAHQRETSFSAGFTSYAPTSLSEAVKAKGGFASFSGRSYQLKEEAE